MTTTTQPQVDIEELAHYFTPEPTYADGATIEARSCARCGEWYALSDEATEPTRFCHNCAHLLCEESLPALIAEVRALRAKAQGGGAESEPESDNWLPAKHTPPLPGTDVRFRVGGGIYVGRLVHLPFGDFVRAEEGDFALSIVSWMPLPAPPEAKAGR